MMKLTPSSLLMNFPITSLGGRKIDGPLKSVWKAKKNLPLMLLRVRSHTFMIFAFGPSSQKKVWDKI